MRNLKEITINCDSPFCSTGVQIYCEHEHEASEFIKYVNSRGYHWIWGTPDGITRWKKGGIYYLLWSDFEITHGTREIPKRETLFFTQFKSQFMPSEKIFQPVDDSVLYD